MEKITWGDIEVVCLVEYHEAHIEFKTYEIVGHCESAAGVYDKPLFEKRGEEGESEIKDTEDLEEAQVFIKGSIKWDACSHIYFGDGGYIHVCGGRMWKVLLETQKRVFSLAYEYFKKPHQREEFEDFFTLLEQG